MRNRLALVVGALALASCGKVADLEPAAGHSLPQKPALAATTPTSEELLALPPYAKPDRVDELLKRGEKRKPDRFDLPPPSGEAAPIVEETNSTNSAEPEIQPQELAQ